MARKKPGVADERVMRAALAERDLELVSVDEHLPDGTIAASASKLHVIACDARPCSYDRVSSPGRDLQIDRPAT